jgi:hypothetical protein
MAACAFIASVFGAWVVAATRGPPRLRTRPRRPLSHPISIHTVRIFTPGRMPRTRSSGHLGQNAPRKFWFRPFWSHPFWFHLPLGRMPRTVAPGSCAPPCPALAPSSSLSPSSHF